MIYKAVVTRNACKKKYVMHIVSTINFLHKCTKQVNKHSQTNLNTFCFFRNISYIFLVMWAKWSQTQLTKIMRHMMALMQFLISQTMFLKIQFMLFSGVTDNDSHTEHPNACKRNAKLIQNNSNTIWEKTCDFMACVKTIKPVIMQNYTCWHVDMKIKQLGSP